MNAQTDNTAALLKFVPGQTRAPEPKSYYGLDLGQRHDHSALAALDLTWTHLGYCGRTFAQIYQPRIDIRALYRFPLGLDYDTLHGLLTERLAERHNPHDLIIDAGGPGPPVVDRLRKSLRANIAIRPVLITGGRGQNTLSGGYTGIPRRTLISTLLYTIGAHSIVCEEGLPNWEIFEGELIELRGDTAHPGDSKSHDDLVMAVALALNAAVSDTPQLMPADEQQESERVRYGFIDKPLF